MQRLKTRPQFQAVLAGTIVSRTEHFALHRYGLEVGMISAMPGRDTDIPGQTPVMGSISTELFHVRGVWIGAMVPKRWAKRAVTRNAIKRQVYTLGAELLPKLVPAVFLVRLRKEFSRQQFQSAVSTQLKDAVRTEVLSLMQRVAASK